MDSSSDLPCGQCARWVAFKSRAIKRNGSFTALLQHSARHGGLWLCCTAPLTKLSSHILLIIRPVCLFLGWWFGVRLPLPGVLWNQQFADKYDWWRVSRWCSGYDDRAQDEQENNNNYYNIIPYLTLPRCISYLGTYHTYLRYLSYLALIATMVHRVSFQYDGVNIPRTPQCNGLAGWDIIVLDVGFGVWLWECGWSVLIADGWQRDPACNREQQYSYDWWGPARRSSSGWAWNKIN